jgi:LuxR family maltose regulon positive regulatory protein
VETPLLATKLNVPPVRAGLVARPRLLERLKACREYSLILVTAPAGFGKTTLLSEWLHQSPVPLAASWFSVEEGYNDPVRFWEYFIAGLRKVRPAVGEASLSLLRSSQPLLIEAVLTPLINDLNSVPHDILMVLDDYHFIKTAHIHGGIGFLLDHLPPQAHLALTTRIDPPLPLARFRGRGQMLEITADDLRFTPDEVTSLFHELGTTALSPENVMALRASDTQRHIDIGYRHLF